MGSIAWKALAGVTAASVLLQMPLSMTIASAGLAAIAYALAPRNTIQR